MRLVLSTTAQFPSCLTVCLTFITEGHEVGDKLSADHVIRYGGVHGNGLKGGWDYWQQKIPFMAVACCLPLDFATVLCFYQSVVAKSHEVMNISTVFRIWDLEQFILCGGRNHYLRLLDGSLEKQIYLALACCQIYGSYSRSAMGPSWYAAFKPYGSFLI